MLGFADPLSVERARYYKDLSNMSVKFKHFSKGGVLSALLPSLVCGRKFV